MTGQIQEAHHNLEGRVAARTAELAAARAEADKANRAKSEFLSLMSHDLRTPLNAILGFAQLLETEPLTPEQADHVRNILNGGRHLLALVSDVQDITRIEGGQLGLSLEPVAVGAAVRQAVELVGPMAAHRAVVVRVADVADDVAVLADGQRLSQVLLNLLSNAVKYNRAHGRVDVSAEIGPNGRCRIAVSDTGIGIEPEKVARLFQPFERLGAEQTGVEGTGLGLALSRALAAAMRGTISVSSTPGKGSTFWLELPVADAGDVREAPAREPDAHIAPPTTGVVLYIEDNLSNVRLLQRILQRRPGIELLHAQTGAAGFDLARKHLPDAVLLDMHLPDTTGEDVLRLLAADPRTRDIPKVVVTADATPGLAPRLEAAGARACMTKPLSVPAILGIIDRLLARPGTSTNA
jgi:CheY-like chemotaxis protein/nitrogen-specific signal transduction histidine kinase